MLDSLQFVGTRVSGRPLMLWFVVLALLVVVRRRGVPGGSDSSRVPGWLPTRTIAVAALLGLSGYVVAAVWYASDPHFFDNAEPTVVAIGWLFHAGQPIYHLPDSAERYALIYGPMAFIVHGFALAMLGPGIGISKALGAGAGLVSLALVYGVVRRHVTALRALVLTGVCALLLLLFRDYSFWTRPEPLQLLAGSAALLFALSGRAGMAAVLTGLASGVLWNLKFTGPMYSLPVFVLLQQRTGWRGASIAAVVAVAVAFLPFVIFPNVSLVNYLTWVSLSARTGLLLSMLRQNLEWAAFFGVPLLLSYYAVPRELRPAGPEWRNVMVALWLGMVSVVIAAAKPGAGPYHLMPFLPVIMYVVAWQASKLSPSVAGDPAVPAGSIAFVLAAVIIALTQQAQLVTVMKERRLVRDVEDIEQFAAGHHGIVEMGYGGTEASTLVRPVLVFRNDSYLLDQPAVREHQLAGLDLPQATVDAMAHCRVNYWLIPKGEEPFSGRNEYAAVFRRPLFPDEFRRVFHATHKRVAMTAYYDVWQCQAGGGT